MTMRKVLQEILEKNQRFHHLTPLKTKHIAHWCRCHGYTPPDPESLRNDGDSIEDVLTQIDSEPGKPLVGLAEQQQQSEGCLRGTLSSPQPPWFWDPFSPSIYQDSKSYCGGQEPLLSSDHVSCLLSLPVQPLQKYPCPRVPSVMPLTQTVQWVHTVCSGVPLLSLEDFAIVYPPFFLQVAVTSFFVTL